MFRLFPYIRKYAGWVMLAIVLLFVQANADLALPDYLSRIVNIGLQQGGVESALPDALRTETYDHMLLFLTPAEQAQVQAAYARLEPSAAGYTDVAAKYSALNGQALYVLQTLDAAQREALTPIVGRGLVTLSFLQQLQSDPEKMAAMGQGLGFDPSKLPDRKSVV